MEEVSLSLLFCDFHTAPYLLLLSLSLQPSLLMASLFLPIIPLSLLPPALVEGEERKMYDRITLLNRHSQIMDYPISETSGGIVHLNDRGDGWTEESGEWEDMKEGGKQ